MNVCVGSVKDGGQAITVYGWMDGHSKFKKGDRVLLVQQNGSESRYRIREYRPCGDPYDMYFLDLTFEPRGAATNQTRSAA